MIQTGDSLISCFENIAENHNKIFFQTERDESNADRLVKYFNLNGGISVAEQCMELFMKSEKEPVVFLLDFVVKLGSIMESIKVDNQEREEFRRLLRETQERMKGDSN
jgi:hypothetical protein